MISNMHQQQHISTSVAPNANNNFEILTLGHPNTAETNCFGQYGDIRAIPIDIQSSGHNIGFNQHSYSIIANLANSTKDNMLFSVQTTAAAVSDGLANGGNYQNGNTDESPTYFLLQNIHNYAPIEVGVPLKIGTDLLVLNANGSIQTESGACDTVATGTTGNNNDMVYQVAKPAIEMAAADSSVDVQYQPENDDVMIKKEEKPLIAGLAPDHHARRPMNAFLIFCKRHRTLVREKYPNLENR